VLRPKASADAFSTRDAGTTEAASSGADSIAAVSPEADACALGGLGPDIEMSVVDELFELHLRYCHAHGANFTLSSSGPEAVKKSS
jgi:hypothetical protein